MNQGEFTLLTIEAYDGADYDLDSNARALQTFRVMFNPEKYSRKYQVQYEREKGRNRSSSPQIYKGIKPDDFQLEFILDGTGASEVPLTVNSSTLRDLKKQGKLTEGEENNVNVETKIKELLNLAHKSKGSIHRPGFLKVYWGTFMARCVLSTVDANYTLFAADGTALRAKVTCKFLGVKSNGRRVNDDRNNSPDLTHNRLISRNDRIDNYAFEIYKDSSFYLQVARFNGLKNFRRLRIGSELILPPLKTEQT